MATTTSWFAGCTTADEIKKRFRELVFKHHPDKGGDTATMQDINEQYHAALKGQHEQSQGTTDNGRERTYYYNEQRENEAAAKLMELIKLRLPASVEIWLIGSWVWVWGDTKPHKEKLKAAGLRWHSKRSAWYWHKPGKRTWRSNGSLEDLAAKYGAYAPTKEREEEEKKAAA